MVIYRAAQTAANHFLILFHSCSYKKFNPTDEAINIIPPGGPMRSYFCGWYYRCQSDCQTLAIIPSVHKTKDSAFCAIQLITDVSSFHVQLPYSDFQKNGDQIQIGKNRFGKDGIRLDIQTPECRAVGAVRFGPFTPIGYNIMGPFRYVPFMQCRHSVYSMRHRVDGQFLINGVCYGFENAVGYIEGDRGHSFPREYMWTQCSFPEGALMLSVADIPIGGFHFTGIIGIVLLNKKEYRFATYLGAEAVKIEAGEVLVRQGKLSLTIKNKDQSGHPLRAPVGAAMTRTIHEHPSCKVYYRFEDNGFTLLELEAPNAAFEYEY